MNLLKLHKLLTYLLLLLPFSLLFLGGEIKTAVSLVFVCGLPLCWFFCPARSPLTRHPRLSTALTLALFALTALRMLTGELMRIEPLVEMVLLLTLIRLASTRSPADWAQLLALGFLLMVSASVFNQGLSFALAFAVYLVLGTLTLTIKHLHEELFEHHQQRLHEFRVRFGFVGGVAGLAIVLSLFCLFFFITFPRIGVGLFNRGLRPGLLTSGFDGEVSLGSHGLIRDDDTIVMRIRLPSGPTRAQQHELRWRGISFATYDGRSWRGRERGRSAQYDRQSQRYQPRPLSETEPPLLDESRLLPQEVYLEPLSTDVLFALPNLVALQFPEEDAGLPRSYWRQHIDFTLAGEAYLRRQAATGVHYIAYSYPETFTGQQNCEHEPELSAHCDRYRALYPQVTPRLYELARSIADPELPPRQVAERLESYLRNNYTYTTDLPPVDLHDPIEDFLFTTRRGHCEYFASSMVLLARANGLYARLVNGFLGGDWNTYGSFYAVRQSHAHSWVEIMLPEQGWVTFDPTPAVELSSPSRYGWWISLLEMIDSVRMLWYEHVISYDLDKQVRTARTILGALGAEDPIPNAYRSWTSDARRNSALISLHLTMWLLALWLLTKRHRRELFWTRRDTLLVVIWLSLALSTLALFWKPQVGALQLLIGGSIPLVTSLFAWLLREPPSNARIGHRKSQLGPLSREYLILLERLKHVGYDLPLSTTAAKVLSQATRLGAPYLPDLSKCLEQYELLRFGQHTTPEQIRSWRSQTRKLRPLIDKRSQR